TGTNVPPGKGKPAGQAPNRELKPIDHNTWNMSSSIKWMPGERAARRMRKARANQLDTILRRSMKERCRLATSAFRDRQANLGCPQASLTVQASLFIIFR